MVFLFVFYILRREFRTASFQVEQAFGFRSIAVFNRFLRTNSQNLAAWTDTGRADAAGMQFVKKNEREQAVAKAAFALMTQYEISPTPENFELFYAYAASEKPAVSHLIGQMIAMGQPFTPEILADLHKRISTVARAQDVVEDVGNVVSATLGSMLETLEIAGQDTLAYGRTLSAASGALGDDQSPDALRTLVDGLMGATRAMEARAKDLEDELQRSSIEVAELKSKLDDVRKESMTDTLTGIPNRKCFDIELSNAISDANKTGDPLTLFMCDIDYFKSFNDTWGHQTGDQVLRLVAACLSENVKGRDTAARYGGEEFAVILRQTALEHGVRLADQIRNNVQGKKLVKKSTGDILGTITISAGVAQFIPGEEAEGLVKRADSCLYAAKHAGRNCVLGENDSRIGAITAAA
jgi:diguanylate cyclase